MHLKKFLSWVHCIISFTSSAVCLSCPVLHLHSCMEKKKNHVQYSIVGGSVELAAYCDSNKHIINATTELEDLQQTGTVI